MERYQGKKVVIIGGTSGMGLATAKMLLDGGARVLVTGRSQAGLDSAQKELGEGALVVSSDARSLTEIDALASRVKAEFDTFDLLFVNAGFSIRAPLESMTEAVYDEMFNLNAKGPLFAVQKLAPLINRGGSVVLTTSIANVKGMPGNAAYGAAKAALRSFARTLAAELLPREIRVNAVTPGPIDTPILGKAFADKDAVAQIREKMTGMVPDEALGKVGGNRQGRPLPRVRRDLHDRRRTSGRWGLVATLKCSALHTLHQDGGFGVTILTPVFCSIATHGPVAAMTASSEENSRGRPSGFFDILHDGFSFLTKRYDILLTCGFQPRTIRTVRFRNPHRRGWPC